MVSAGHLPPVVRHGAAAAVVQLEPGPLLGIGGRPDYPETRVPVAEGDLLVLFTDGLVERRGEPIHDGLARLAVDVATLHPEPATVCEQLVAARLATGAGDGDDIAVLAARF